MKNEIIKVHIPKLIPNTSDELFRCNRSSIPEAVGIIWNKIQCSIKILNDALDILDSHIKANDYAALEAQENGLTAIDISKQYVEEAKAKINDNLLLIQIKLNEYLDESKEKVDENLNNIKEKVDENLNNIDNKINEVNEIKQILNNTIDTVSVLIQSIVEKLENGEFNGQDGNVEFDELTEDQIAQLKGPQGPPGPQGPQGIVTGVVGGIEIVIMSKKAFDSLSEEEKNENIIYYLYEDENEDEN